MLIQTNKDLEDIQGKFVIQLNDDQPNKSLMDFKWSFAKEKRLKIVCGYGFINLYGFIKNYKTFEKFKRVFNNYLFDDITRLSETDGGGRFHRLLTYKEIDYLCEKLKEENY